MVKGCKITCNTNFSLIEKDGEFVCEPDKCDFTDFKDITNIKTISGLKHNNTCKIDSCNNNFTPINSLAVDKDGKSLNYCKKFCSLNPNTTHCNVKNTESTTNSIDGCECNCKTDSNGFSMYEGKFCNIPMECDDKIENLDKVEGNMVRGCKYTCLPGFNLITDEQGINKCVPIIIKREEDVIPTTKATLPTTKATKQHYQQQKQQLQQQKQHYQQQKQLHQQQKQHYQQYLNVIYRIQDVV